ncbi:MAG: hypothetical protein GY715_15525, partial [Planctomycetes bacterium]|nr:hypothetical protein [Planctomycetota bacterium]
GAALAVLPAHDGGELAILIGAPGLDGLEGENSGKVVAITLANKVLWEREGRTSWSLYGGSLACVGDIDGDGCQDVAVGAPFYPSIVEQRGRVEVLSGSDGHLLWDWDGSDVQRQFGDAVAGGDDVNGDGCPDVLVGAPSLSPIDPRPGQVTVWSGSTGEQLWSWSGETDRDWFGFSVALAGDVDEDGHADVAVGAPAADVPLGENAGRVYLRSGRTGELLWANDGETALSNYGYAVAAIPPSVGAGNDLSLVVGALDYPGAPGQNGKVYVCSGRDGRTIWSTVGEFGSQLGKFVASAGDMNGDGSPDIAVSAGNAAFFLGSVEVRDALDGRLHERWLGESALINFGDAIASVGDADQDGFGELLIGAASFQVRPGFSPGKTLLYSGTQAADINCDVTVDLLDLNLVLAEWGSTETTRADIDGDGMVGFSDILLVLASWS